MVEFWNNYGFPLSIIIVQSVGLIVSYYAEASVASAFLSASAMFGGAAIYGATTKRNLNSVGGFLFMGMIGILVASLVNWWLGSSQFGFIIAVIGVIIFTVYTAYDVQKIDAFSMPITEA